MKIKLNPLTLTATSEGTVNPRVGPIPLKLTLSNISLSPLWVNQRMGVGYADSLVREIYFAVYAPDGTLLPEPDETKVDVHRMPPEKENFALLGPGEAVATFVDLALWYHFREVGRHQIVFTYENHWDGRKFGVEAFTGKAVAPPLSVTIE